eukprot:15328965-Ditylum_brightwellii.AAC.1
METLTKSGFMHSSIDVVSTYALPVGAVPPPDSNEYNSCSKELNKKDFDELRNQGFTRGLAKALSINCSVFPVRYWVIDNSGSMNKPDGHRIIETLKRNNVNIVSCTRWEEIKECVNYHVRMSALLCAPTIFRLLNNPGLRVGPQEFSVAESGQDLVPQDQQAARVIMNNARPS